MGAKVCCRKLQLESFKEKPYHGCGSLTHTNTDGSLDGLSWQGGIQYYQVVWFPGKDKSGPLPEAEARAVQTLGDHAYEQWEKQAVLRCIANCPEGHTPGLNTNGWLRADIA